MNYLTLQIVQQEMAKYTWPSLYNLSVNEGIEVEFAAVTIEFFEVPQDDMYCYISIPPFDSEAIYNEYHIYMDVIIPKVKQQLLADVDYNDEYTIWSEANVREKLNNVLVRLQAYYLPTLAGDRTLINEYLAYQNGSSLV
jgi:hypothetical protein